MNLDSGFLHLPPFEVPDRGSHPINCLWRAWGYSSGEVRTTALTVGGYSIDDIKIPSNAQRRKMPTHQGASAEIASLTSLITITSPHRYHHYHRYPQRCPQRYPHRHP